MKKRYECCVLVMVQELNEAKEVTEEDNRTETENVTQFAVT